MNGNKYNTLETRAGQDGEERNRKIDDRKPTILKTRVTEN
jgi:hypothetical protein